MRLRRRVSPTVLSPPPRQPPFSLSRLLSTRSASPPCFVLPSALSASPRLLYCLVVLILYSFPRVTLSLDELYFRRSLLSCLSLPSSLPSHLPSSSPSYADTSAIAHPWLSSVRIYSRGKMCQRLLFLAETRKKERERKREKDCGG